MNLEEYLDLYDHAGTPLHRIIRRDDPLDPCPEGAYWRVCDAWIMRPDGAMLIQRRAECKATYPGLWNCTGGAIQHGESSEQGCLREVQEELGLALTHRDGSMLFEYLSTHSIHEVWLFCKDVSLESLTLQREEVADARFATMDEILRMEKEGSFVSIGYLAQFARMLPIYRHIIGKENATC